MLVKKAPSRSATYAGEDQQELEYLYARRSAIDMLIESLQEYDLSDLKWRDFEKRKSA